MKKKKPSLKSFEYNNQEYIVDEEGNQQSRVVARKYIYLKNRGKYPLKFGYYVVHHIDGDTFNNSIKNLYVCSKKEHNFIHYEQRRIKRKFQTSQEIEFFLAEKKGEENERLSNFYEEENSYVSQKTLEKIKNQNLEDWRTKKSKLGIKNLNISERGYDIIKGNKKGTIGGKSRNKDYDDLSNLDTENLSLLTEKKSQSKNEDKQRIFSFYRYFKKSIILCIKSLIFLFLFPIAYYIAIYIIWGILSVLGYIAVLLINFLFSLNISYISYENSFYVILLNLIKDTPTFVWNFIYGNNSKPLLVIIVIISCFIISYFSKKK